MAAYLTGFDLNLEEEAIVSLTACSVVLSAL